MPDLHALEDLIRYTRLQLLAAKEGRPAPVREPKPERDVPPALRPAESVLFDDLF